jgi:hypothetical protein
MKPTRTRLAVVAAVVSAIAIAAPVSTAGAATAAPVPAVIGPTFITSAPATVINANTQVSASGTSSGNQFAS